MFRKYYLSGIEDIMLRLNQLILSDKLQLTLFE